ncbi:WD40-repeat-containing domain protein [Radiomyces spectabilis]|uniref:WD40-repeat-containing domain protein n=1 Tax=Radiomyces spectabilis TaxID=64574 RepID=UPI00221EC7FA|nr:WD40-repeat-containing domain protein [Radiomyces spectabilis]KAI8371365.1 WD40-repeat-containing domain protein [Radiomyces spectabilis]
MKKQVIQGKSVLDTLLPITAITKTLSEEDFRIIVGTYERILYGINAYWEMEDSVNKRCLRLEPIFIVPAHTGLIRTVAVGGHFLASGSTDEIIRLYDVKKRKEYGSLGGHHQGDITDLQFHGKYMFSASDDKTICLWRTKDWEYLKTLKGHKGRINSLAIHPSGKIALSVSSDKTVVLWNLMTAHKASTTKLGRDEGQIVLWNSAGNQYAIMFDRKVCVYNVSDAQVATTIEQRSRLLCMRYYHSATNDKDYIITGSEDKKIRIWDASSGTCVAELSGHQWRIKTIDVIVSKPDAQEDQEIGVLISVSSDGVIKTWDIEGAIQAEDKDTIEPLGEYNIKARATCSTVHTGFAKKVAEKSAKQEKKNKEKTTED